MVNDRKGENTEALEQNLSLQLCPPYSVDSRLRLQKGDKGAIGSGCTVGSDCLKMKYNGKKTE